VARGNRCGEDTSSALDAAEHDMRFVMLTAREFVQQMFPNRAFVPASAVGRLIGLAPQTVRNNISAGTFPVPTTRIANKRVVPLPALIEFLERHGFAGSDDAAPAAPEPPRRRGRPRKTAPAGEKGGAK
jgi:hypothetical protein